MNPIPALALVFVLFGIAQAQTLQLIEAPSQAVSRVNPCTFVTLMNKGKAPVEVSAEVMVQELLDALPVTLDLPGSPNCSAAPPKTSVPLSVPEGGAVVVRVNFSPDALQRIENDVKGQLLMTTGSEAVVTPVALTKPPNLSQVLYELFLPLLGAVLLVLAVLIWSDVDWSQDMKAVEWSGEKSWAGNLALLASLVTALGGFVTIGEADKPRLAILGVVFSLLSLLAPLLYRTTLHTFINEGQEEQRGPVYGYLLASIITLWSALGGLWAVYRLLTSFERTLAGTEAPWLSDLVTWLCLLIGSVVVAYTCRRLGQNLFETAPARKNPRRKKPTRGTHPRTRSAL